jgi:glyoxylase-like metal-dependent hydrolase (beta-lactamase superfamily II)
MQLTDRVYLVGSGSNGFGLSHDSDCHVYLIDGGSELALVDAGAGPGVAEILANVRGHGFDPNRIHVLLLTHIHADHAGGSAALRAAVPGLRVLVSKDAAPYLREGNEKAISLDLGKKAGYYAPEYIFQPCPVDRELAEGDEIQVGELKLQVLDTPGHALGHVAFVMQDQGVTFLFSGDTLFFGGRILLQSIWDCDLQAHIASLRKLGALPVDVFLPGHLTVSLRNGQRHFQTALDLIDRCLVPPSIF